ncbi:hypothetical protein FB451DRAFT_1563781 [Mycena latifolia]|nr:hypothetical protein FB451DRAFT_1563781 [Mycena latifolia]
MPGITDAPYPSYPETPSPLAFCARQVFTIENTWRDDDEIETSSGSPPLEVSSISPTQSSPPRSGTRIRLCPRPFMCTTNPADSRDYSFISLDLEQRVFDDGTEEYGAVLFIHPDGIPTWTVFTDSTNDEVVRLWDIRARKMVYELSTGNNAVNGMAWDAAHRALYVSTTCSFMDRNGYTSDYRRVRLLPSMLPEPEPRGRMPNYDDEGAFDKC